MQQPLVSVIIPAYNGARHLGEAIQSVLDQTYGHLELIVVDDASQDASEEVVSRFNDPRVKFIAHRVNRGACSARKTGIEASTGEIVSFLDQDDLLHPEKLANHVAYHQANPDVGFSYNAFFNLHHSSNDIRDVYMPPSPLTLADLVLGFPIPPSCWTLKRQWALREENWEESTFLHGREYVFCGRLFLAGCIYGRVEGALNYRRHHGGRLFSSLAAKCRAELRCQELVFTDPRYPQSLLSLEEPAYARTHLQWAYIALFQSETQTGQDLLRKAIALRPHLVTGTPTPLTVYLMSYAVDQRALDHEEILRRICDQLPAEAAFVRNDFQWASAQGHVVKGTRSVLWNDGKGALFHFEKAVQLGARLDTTTAMMVTDHLFKYTEVMGSQAGENALHDIEPYLARLSNRGAVRHLKGRIAFNRAFQRYRSRKFRDVPRSLVQAVINDPSYLGNRGAWSILLRSGIGWYGQLGPEAL